ncbi:hypothetical protein ALC56_00007, partial [Trachymyrmex septentrionalis]
ILCSQNVLEICRHLPNVILLEESKLLSHFDYITAIDIKTLIYDRVIEVFQKFNNEM